jgi:hypothetical protein
MIGIEPVMGKLIRELIELVIDCLAGRLGLIEARSGQLPIALDGTDPIIHGQIGDQRLDKDTYFLLIEEARGWFHTPVQIDDLIQPFNDFVEFFLGIKHRFLR